MDRAAEGHSPGASKMASWCKELELRFRPCSAGILPACLIAARAPRRLAREPVGPFDFAQGRPPGATYAENELPQPHDFVEFGLTNTKPCCISVSW